MHRSPCAAMLATLVVTCLTGPLAASDGPGIPQLTYASSEVNTTIATFTSANGSPRGQGMVFLHRGYLVVPWAQDGGGGNGTGGFSVYRLTNPRTPELVFTTAGTAGYGSGQANDATNLREPHAINIQGDIVCLLTNSATSGVQFWNFANPLAPTRVGQLVLPGLGGGDYDNTPWWCTWQGRYLYVAGTGRGLYIVDAADPTAPTLAVRGGSRPNPVPTSTLGGFRVAVAWAVGNLLVLSNADRVNGLATLDIGDPLEPVLRHALTTTVGYSCYVNGGRVYGMHDPARAWSIAADGTLALLGQGNGTASLGGYGAIQDGNLFYGSSSHWVKMRVDTAPPYPFQAKIAPTGFTTPDWDFAVPLGNLVFVGNDHTSGSALQVHQAAPDTTPPVVNMVVPANGASGQPLTSRIGLTTTDLIDARTANASSVILRRGGTLVPCRIAVQSGVINLSPIDPLLPATTYEVVVPTGGIRDYAGNAIATAFISSFTTAGEAVVALQVSAGTVAVAEGSTATFQVRLSAAPSTGVTVTVARTSGDTDLTVSGGASLAFSPSDWATWKTVTLAAGQDHDVAAGSAIITCSAGGMAPVTVTATEVDDDTLAIQASASTATVAEGGTATFTVRLSHQPTAPVTVAVARSSGDADITVASGAALGFTSDTWATPQTVTLAAAQDADAVDGGATITCTASGATTATIAATEDDDDVLAILVSASAVTVAEGGSATFTVRLSHQPAGTVTVAVGRETGDTDLAVTGGGSLAFTTVTWATPQTVTLSASQDADVVNGAATIRCSAVGATSAAVAASEADDDVLAVLVSPGALAIAEGGSATFTLRLSHQPAADVTVTVARTAGDVDISVANGASLAFTTTNWATPQIVTLAAAQDADAASGSATITASASGAISATVAVSEVDDDALAIVASSSVIAVAEGASASFTIRLSHLPAGPVTVTTARSAGDADIGVSTGASLVFTTANWATPQTVVLVAAQDIDVVAGSATITASAVGATSALVTATEVEDDSLAIIASPGSVQVSEGGSATFVVRLSHQPAGSLTVAVARSAGDGDLVVAGGSSLSFTVTNWATTQTVTLAAGHDQDLANGTATFACTASGATTATVAASEVDDDILTVIASVGTLALTEGGNASYSIRLSHQPATTVTVTTARSSGDADLTVSVGASRVFTTSNWAIPQAVTIAAAHDADVAADSAVITSSASGAVAATVTAAGSDDDILAILLSSAVVDVAEGGSASVTMRLSHQPGTSITVATARVSGDTDLTLAAGASLVFTTTSWATPQPVTVAAAQDADGLAGAAVFRSTAGGVAPVQLQASEIDDDVVGQPPVITAGPTCTPSPATVGATVAITVSASDPDSATLTYRWDFGDGSPTVTSSTPATTHVYANPGHRLVSVQVSDGTGSTSASRLLTVHRPPTATPPRHSAPIILESAAARVWSVNTDVGTVSAIDAGTLALIREVPVGRAPRTLALVGSTLWVANQDADTISVITPATGALLATIALPYGARPYGIVAAHDGTTAFVSCEGRGTLVRIAAATRTITGTLAVGPSPRALALNHDGTRLLITRFVSPATRGEVVEVSPAAWQVVRTIPLATDPGPDTEAGGRGVPNYLAGIVIAPDGQRAWVPSKKDNTARGAVRDGLPLTFESTVRTIASRIDLETSAERLAERIDFNNADSAVAICFSPLGDWAFVALQGSDAVAVVDTASSQEVTRLLGVGTTPQGLCLSADGGRLFVQNFLSRSIAVHDVRAIRDLAGLDAPALAQVAVVATEALPQAVLRGKRLFYRAIDPRMGKDGYISCASCHVEGGQDGRVWDFTDRGEGLRNTIDLRGRRGMGHGRVHWSGNFDEIQDFEGDIRASFGGSGLMGDADFHTGTRSLPLGDAKAGRAAALDDLAAYVASLDRVARSPQRSDSGALTAAGATGRDLFLAHDCNSCHGGAERTDSGFAQLHDVGTIRATSGRRLGGNLLGLDTPTLLGLADGAPYLHDGSAATLLEVLDQAASTQRHGALAGLTATQRGQIVAYLQQIDDREPAAPAPIAVAVIRSPHAGAAFATGITIPIVVEAPNASAVTVYHGETVIGAATRTGSRWSLLWAAPANGTWELTARALRADGGTSVSGAVGITVGNGPGSFAINVNFQPSMAPTFAGYMADGGAVFAARGNGYTYGWNQANEDTARDRNLPNSPDQRFDTLLHLQKQAVPRFWEIAVPNGRYAVHLVGGDPGYTDNRLDLLVEGVSTVSGRPGMAYPWADGWSVVEVRDGRLSVSVAATATNAKVCFIEIVAVPSGPG